MAEATRLIEALEIGMCEAQATTHRTLHLIQQRIERQIVEHFSSHKVRKDAMQAHVEKLSDALAQEVRERDASEKELEVYLNEKFAELEYLESDDGAGCDGPDEVIDAFARKLALEMRHSIMLIEKRQKTADDHKESLERAMEKFTTLHIERQRQCDQKLRPKVAGARGGCQEALQ